MVNADISEKKLKLVGLVLNNKDKPLKERFRALFCLKNLGGEIAINEIAKCFDDESALLKHELAYCLGQMKDARAIPVLVTLLKNTKLEPVVRHEAGEALGAIGSPDILPVLQEYVGDSTRVVAETCMLAVDRVKYLTNNPSVFNSEYTSIDPAPPFDCTNIEELRSIYLNVEKSLFERYRAMFSLRNIGSNEALSALAEGFLDDSALFRHEVAFVLGQVRNVVSIKPLVSRLEDLQENEMVRHEAAEALGAIGTPETVDILKRFLSDPETIVRESCEVALDMAEYEMSCNFQYADTLSEINKNSV